MLPELYRTHLKNQLNPRLLLTIEVLVWLIQVHKQVRIERLAAHFPLPIKFESRRRHIQRFLQLPQLSVVLLWFPIISAIIQAKIKSGKRVYLAIDRTQWQDKNLFVVAVIIEKRAIPIYWKFLEKQGASNLAEQKAILRPVIRLLQGYEIVILADREFHSVKLASWLCDQQVYFVLRQKKDTLVQQKNQDYQELTALELAPGTSRFLTDIKVNKEKGFNQANLAAYWKRKYRQHREKEPWYLLTNLSNLAEALTAYKKRAGIEAMFKDCKSGGYNLEGSHASIERLTRLVLLIALAYTWATLKGRAIKSTGQQIYISRLRKVQQVLTTNSSFWIGLYGDVWIMGMEFLSQWSQKLMSMAPNKLPFFQRGLRAMSLIQSAF